MTIEGRPEIQHDWEAEYAKQRKDRMQDAIDDYLQDEKVTARRAHEEMLMSMMSSSIIKTTLRMFEDLRDLMLGYRNIDLNLPEVLD